MIKVTVKLDKAAIAKIEKAVLDSAQAAMEQVVTEVQNTAPLDQGDLINGIFVRSEKSGNTVIATIDHSALYSRYLYYGKLMIDPNREKTVKKVMALYNNGDKKDIEKIDEMFKLAFEPAAAKEISEMNMPWAAYQKLSEIVISAMTGQEDTERFHE